MFHIDLARRAKPTEPSIHGDNTLEEWEAIVQRCDPDVKKEACSIVMLITWIIWNERNRQIFDNKRLTALEITSAVKAEAHAWREAGMR